MNTDSIVKYLDINDKMKESINILNILDEDKKKLNLLNDELYSYSIQLSRELKYKASYFFKFVDLPLKYRNDIHKMIIKMFKAYSLCLGPSNQIDDDDLISFFKKIDDYDFWLINMHDCEENERLKSFVRDSKKHCSNLIKCVCYEIDNKQNRVFDNLDKIDSIKYKFDYEFIYPRDMFYKDINKKFKDEGIDITITEADFDYNEYFDNEIFIDQYIAKNKIRYPFSKYDCKGLVVKSTKEKQLKDLIGLDNIKKKIKQMEHLLKFSKESGIDDDVLLNTIFKGNSGTGKTTVAKIYTKMLFDLGYIKQNKMISIVPSDFMAHYVGQTQDKTREILDKASGGVLFIDEAYNLSLAQDPDGGSFMREAVVELLKYMENKDNVVIFAGYTKEMEELLNINPGFKSRIGETITFKDYTLDELVEIFKRNINSKKLTLDKNAIAPLKKLISSKMNVKNFGNARFVEKLVSKVIIKHAENVYENNSSLLIITKEDLDIENGDDKSTFGF